MSETYNDKYIGKLLDGRYQILDVIGIGGMAYVYRALDTRLSRNVAVKIMRDELVHDDIFIQRFNAEAHAVAMLSHNNIVSIYDVYHSDNLEYIVMELINGITLRQYIERKRKLDWREVLHFSKQVAAALEHAHQRGIIHRDIKPQNIMLLKDGTIKVADFGIAALENEAIVHGGQAVGSLNYLSPEQVRGGVADARADIYSLGIMMYEMLCGQKPYDVKTVPELLVTLAGSTPAPITEMSRDVPHEFAEIVNKAFAPNPEDRYQNAEELIEDFDAFTVDFLNTENTKNTDSEIEDTPEIPKRKDRKNYFGSFIRTSRVSFALSSFGLILAIVFSFSLLWKFWMKDIFSPAERVLVPDFRGYSYEELKGNTSLTSLFNFNPNYIVDTSTEGGTILSQEPVAGRSLMKNKNGIDIRLNVSTGYVLMEVPDVIGQNYREATLKLTNAGFTVELQTLASDEIPLNEVISTSPATGEQITAGSTVYLYISGGKEMKFIRMPNLVGLSEEAAINKMTNANLTYAGSRREHSEYELGTVFYQSTPAFAEVQERTNITITVSLGPEITVPVPEVSP